MISRYDLWKILAGITVGLLLFGYGWKAYVPMGLLTGFIYGWSSIYNPKNSAADDYDC